MKKIDKATLKEVVGEFRVCAACYGEVPCHRMEWQFKRTDRCAKHQLALLSECPNCGARFEIPALWSDDWCRRCFLPFAEMVKYQKRVEK